MQVRKVVFEAMNKAPTGTQFTQQKLAKLVGISTVIVRQALQRLNDYGCVATDKTGKKHLFTVTGQPDTHRNHHSPESYKKKASTTKVDTNDVEMFVRMLDKKGELIELSLEQAREVSKQLEHLKKSLGIWTP